MSHCLYKFLIYGLIEIGPVSVSAWIAESKRRHSCVTSFFLHAASVASQLLLLRKRFTKLWFNFLCSISALYLIAFWASYLSHHLPMCTMALLLPLCFCRSFYLASSWLDLAVSVEWGTTSCDFELGISGGTISGILFAWL